MHPIMHRQGMVLIQRDRVAHPVGSIASRSPHASQIHGMTGIDLGDTPLTLS
jgi:hypothetical protein